MRERSIVTKILLQLNFEKGFRVILYAGNNNNGSICARIDWCVIYNSTILSNGQKTQLKQRPD